MALRFIDGFDFYGSSNITEGRWNSLNNGGVSSVAISSGNGRRSTNSLRRSSGFVGFNSPGNVVKLLDNQATWIVGVAVKVGSLDNIDLFSIRDNGTTQVDVVLNTNGTLSLTRNGTTLGTTSSAISTGSFNHLQLYATIHNTTGVAKLKLNNVLEIDLTSQNTRNSANNYGNEFVLGNSRIQYSVMTTVDFDDLYVCDGSGSSPYNDFLGDCRVDTGYPTGDSSVQFTPSTGGTNYNLVDETPVNTSDYVDSSTSGHVDLYDFTDPPTLTTPTIYAIAVNHYAQNPEAGGQNLKAHIKNNTTTADGATYALTNAWKIYQSVFINDPNTGAQWASQSAVNSTKVGQKIA
jgi:hypothetical protein